MKQKSTISLSPLVNHPVLITNDITMTKAVVILSKLNQELDKMTADKEKLTKPMNEALKEIRGRYKPFEAKLEGAIAHVRKQMSEYQTKALEIAQKKQEKIAAKVGLTLSPELAIKKLAAIETPQEEVITAFGSLSFRTVKKWRVVDADKVPRSALTPNEDVITAAMKANTPIEGIEYYTEQQPVNRR